MTAKVNEANGYLEQIAQLNDSIKQSGKQSNDLLDKRDVLVEELSKIVDINVAEQTDGTYQISINSGETLVNGSSVNKLATVADGDPATSEVVVSNSTGGELS
ncbi:hypothetical protein JQK62_24605, partial [Leptospira santarosai]|nr:hypothetical protein [Leptospira santarosai]